MDFSPGMKVDVDVRFLDRYLHFCSAGGIATYSNRKPSKGRNCSMKHLWTKIAIGLSVCLLLLIITNGTLAEEKKVIEEKIALVNGKPIDKAAYDWEMKKISMKYEQSGKKLSDTEKERYEAEVLDQLITIEVLFQESEKKGIKVDPKKVEQQFDMLLKRYPDKEKFDEFLKQWGVTEERIKVQIRRNTAIQELIKTSVADKIKVDGKDAKKFYNDNPERFKSPEEIKTSHIMIKLDPKKASNAKKKNAKKRLERVKGRLEKGEDFGVLAKEISEGPSSKTGGDLGFISRGQMVKPFEDAAFALKTGEVSDIIETQFGYHLIKVFEKKAAKMRTFEEVKDRLTNQLKQHKTQEKAIAYIQDLKNSAEIERKDSASNLN
jgi:peptidyl-prolyl cis-trans isomerase C